MQCARKDKRYGCGRQQQLYAPMVHGYNVCTSRGTQRRVTHPRRTPSICALGMTRASHPPQHRTPFSRRITAVYHLHSPSPPSPCSWATPSPTVTHTSSPKTSRILSYFIPTQMKNKLSVTSFDSQPHPLLRFFLNSLLTLKKLHPFSLHDILTRHPSLASNAHIAPGQLLSLQPLIKI